jgi:hypothetical protein
MIVPASINLAPTGQPAPAIWYFIVACPSVVAGFALPDGASKLLGRVNVVVITLGRRRDDRQARHAPLTAGLFDSSTPR